jgi:hypothetical protein
MKVVTPVAVALIALLIAPRLTLADGNDFVAVELRIDEPAIAYAGAYQVSLYAAAAARPSSSDFTNAYLGVWLDDLPGTYGKSFTQVGLINRSDGFRWFVYAEDGFSYCRGTIIYGGRGCEGWSGDIVAENNWYNVELRNTGSHWDAMVYDTTGWPWVVATVNKISFRIYRATVVMEEGYTSLPDPYYYIANFMYHPKVLVNYQTYEYADWPRSSTGIDVSQSPQRFSWLYTASLPVGLPVCPDHYGAAVNYGQDEYFWATGSGLQTCVALMFWPRAYIPHVRVP